MIPLVGALIKTVTGGLVQRFVTDPSKKQDAEIEIERSILRAVSEANTAQMAVNEQEAQHKSVFVAGWRPFIGWICGLGIGFQFIARPILNWILLIARPETPQLPSIDIEAILTLVMGMLGLGTQRMLEKRWGVARESDPRRK